MNNPSDSRPVNMERKQISKFRGFTLIEMLVVVAIIGILASLITAAAWRARIAGKNAAVSLELHSLEMALQEYKNQHGEFPPDFCGLNSGVPAIVQDAQQKILRHLAKAFPRYQPGVTGGTPNTWSGFASDVNAGWGIDVNTQLSPFNALRFWLGGRFDTAQGLFTGFDANPANPFGTGPSRIKPLVEFDPNRMATDGRYWPKEAVDNKTTGAIVYFRAENNRYDYKSATDTDSQRVFPAVDDQQCKPTLGTPLYVYVNPKTFQIFSAGLDYQYQTPAENATFYPSSSSTQMPEQPLGPYIYPSGANYDPANGGHTFDDITNFSGGTLESKIP